MSPDEHEHVAQKLETLIRDTQATIDRLETFGLNQTSLDDYQALLDILDFAVKQQRAHTMAMLEECTHCSQEPSA
jgi:flagellar biosynthesis chaperone FliJ